MRVKDYCISTQCRTKNRKGYVIRSDFQENHHTWRLTTVYFPMHPLIAIIYLWVSLIPKILIEEQF